MSIVLELSMSYLSESSATLDLSIQAIYNSAHMVDVLDDNFICCIRSINKLCWQISTEDLLEYKAKIMEGVCNNKSLSIPKQLHTKKLLSLYKEAMENVTDLNEQIPVTKKALQDGPIQKGSKILAEVEKYRRHLGIKN